MTNIHIQDTDLNNPDQAIAVVELLNHYANDPMGGATPLSPFCRANLIAELQKRPTIHVALAYVDAVPAGLCICIEGFSTFACEPLLNIHDLAVHQDFRGRGIARQLLAHAEQRARATNCCKITLEVLKGNRVAYTLYENVGFKQYQLDPAAGGAILLQKKLMN